MHNYLGLKLPNCVLITIERVVDSIVRTQVKNDDMCFGLQLGKVTADGVFTLHQMHRKYVAKHRSLHVVFVNLEKAFDRVPKRFCHGIC